MKKIFVLFFFAICAFAANAQEIQWTNNLDKAVELADKSKKPLMLFFTGSDWCGWCKRLQGEVFMKPEFEAWVNKNVIPVEVDFPRGKQLPAELQTQNAQLQQFFGIQGYPTIWFVNAGKKDGKVSFEKIGSTGYVAGGPNAWLGVADGILKKTEKQ